MSCTHGDELIVPGPPLASFEADQGLPGAVDVVVVGGGIAGVCTALELLERGHSVALCEKGEIACEQSSRNWGWIRVSRRDVREIELVLEAQRGWGRMACRVGEDVGYVRSGIGFVAHDRQELERQERWLEHARPYRVRARMLDGPAFRERFPGMDLSGVGALVTDDDGRAEPQLAAPAIARACRRLGGTILTGCAVRGIEREAGAISAVITEAGRIRCSAVVIAGGAWSSLFCASIGVRLPQLKLLSSALRTAPLSAGPATAFWTSRYSVRARIDGGYTVATGHYNIADIVPDSFRYARQFLPALRAEWNSIALRVGRQSLREFSTPRRWALDQVSPFEKTRVLDPLPSERHVRRALAALADDCKAFSEARVEQVWAGMIDVTPDALPVISGVADVPGLHIATGFSGHGFGIAPGAGRLMADIVTGGTPVVDPAPFRLSRFEDGTPIVLEPSGV